MDNGSLDNGMVQEANVHRVALMMIQHDFYNELLHQLLLTKRLEAPVLVFGRTGFRNARE